MRILVFLALLGVGGLLHAQSPVSFSSSNLPIIVIDTNGQPIQDEPKTAATMGVINNGEGKRNNLSDPFTDYNGKIGIEVRGSSSQMFPKKQYGFETRDDLGVALDTTLLGLPSEHDWVLFAPYNDKSLMRDALAYHLSRSIGRYAPRTRYCEVVLNGTYQGVYVLMEKVKRDKNRVDINKLNNDENTGNSVTGGYILKIDKSSGNSGEGFVSAIRPTPRTGNQEIYFQYEYPKYDEITASQKQYIQNFIQQFEAALFSTSFQDPVNGYGKYIDVDSFVDYYLLQELSKNVDGYRLSTFLHKQKDSDGGKLVMGPVWDFNLGFGNADYCTSGNPEGFVLGFNSVCPDDWWLIPFWWNQLLSDATFRGKVAARWESLRQNQFSQGFIHGYIDSVATALNVEARQRNFDAWPVLGQYIWPNYYVGSTYAEEVTWLKNWVTQRLLWLDSVMPKVITGLEEDELLTQPFPNPFHDDVDIRFNSISPGIAHVQIFELSGRVAYGEAIEVQRDGVQSFRWHQPGPPQVFVYKIEQQGAPVQWGRLLRQ